MRIDDHTFEIERKATLHFLRGHLWSVRSYRNHARKTCRMFADRRCQLVITVVRQRHCSITIERLHSRRSQSQYLMIDAGFFHMPQTH